MIILGTKKPQKQATSLQEKQSGFKFKMPSVSAKQADMPMPIANATLVNRANGLPDTNAKKPNATPANKVDCLSDTNTEKPVASTGLINREPDKSNANKLLIGKERPSLLATKSTPIPAMSADKYEVVANSVPEFSEEAGDKFTQQLDMLQQAIDGTGELKDQMVNILTFLDDNPQYKENVSPKDVSVFVAACRKVAGITVTEKTTRKTSKTKSTAKVEEVISDLADLEFTL